MLAPVLALATALQTPAEMGKGAYLYHACIAAVRVQDASQPNEEDISMSAECSSYVSGFIDASSLAPALCLPNTTVATVVRLYVNYMAKHPKLMDKARGQGLFYSLSDAYSCPK